MAPTDETPVKFEVQLETAFDVAERTFGVPRLLAVEDLMSNMEEQAEEDVANSLALGMSSRLANLGFDERSVITYVAKLRQVSLRPDFLSLFPPPQHKALHARSTRAHVSAPMD